MPGTSTRRARWRALGRSKAPMRCVPRRRSGSGQPAPRTAQPARPMRDMGLDEAIRAAGGVSALARKIGISQPSISSWPRVPAERVLAVESATGIDRATLRPDLFAQPADNVDEVDAARAREYALL